MNIAEVPLEPDVKGFNVNVRKKVSPHMSKKMPMKIPYKSAGATKFLFQAKLSELNKTE